MQYKIIKEAREWIGTPFHHQQCVKHHGVDCVNLITGIGNNLGICETLSGEFSTYPEIPSPKFFIKGMEKYLKKINESDVKPGDICAVAWRNNLPMHAALYIGNNSIIHTSRLLNRVIEVYMDDNFKSKIHSWWRYRGV